MMDGTRLGRTLQETGGAGPEVKSPSRPSRPTLIGQEWRSAVPARCSRVLEFSGCCSGRPSSGAARPPVGSRTASLVGVGGRGSPSGQAPGGGDGAGSEGPEPAAGGRGKICDPSRLFSLERLVLLPGAPKPWCGHLGPRTPIISSRSATTTPLLQNGFRVARGVGKSSRDAPAWSGIERRDKRE